MAMIAGSMFQFGTGIIKSAMQLPITGIACIMVYMACTRWCPRIPAVIVSLCTGLLISSFTGQFNREFVEFTYQLPSLYAPHFSWGSFLGISLPIFLLLLGTEASQGITVLKQAGYRPPVNAIIMSSGIGTMIAGLFGGHSACIGGIMSALCSSERVGAMEQRYAASFVSGVFLVLFGLLASVSLTLIRMLPLPLIQLIAGLALIGVLLSSLQKAFHGKRFQMGAFFALIISTSGVELYGISSTFWALVGGWLVSLLLETKDFGFSSANADKEVSNYSA